MKRTAVRELLKVAARPEIISFAGGLPAAELFPIPDVREAMDAVLSRVGAKSLQYTETEGIGELREWIAEKFSRSTDAGSGVRAENVLITSGAQQALDLMGRVLLNEGETVVVENPTYLALLSAWRPLGVEFLAAHSDANGICTETLEPLFRRAPKLLYITPNFQNPQGTTLELERRKTLLRLARSFGVGIVEDNPYGELRYEGQGLPHLLNLDRLESGFAEWGMVIHTGTFSKVLMPGLRVGWVIAAREVIEKLVQVKQAADLHTSTLTQHIALEMLRKGVHDEFLPVLIANYRKRRDAMLSSLETHFRPEFSWTRPQGGMFLMLKLPQALDAGKFLSEALKQGVAYVPGEEFHLNGAGRNTLRLNFSHEPPSRIEEGIERLAKVLSGSSTCARSTHHEEARSCAG